MSGIGVIATYGQPIPQEMVERMATALLPRGEVLLQWQQPQIVLLQALWQEQVPREAFQATFPYHIAGDVRLYYRKYLCRLLGDNQLESLSDLELVMHAYASWGERCVEHLEGDYSFAIWDQQRQQLFVGRSPLGLRPLLFIKTSTYLLLASDMTILRAAYPQLPLELDPTWIALFLVEDRHRGGTMFLSPEDIAPGSYLILRDGICTRRSFWPPTRLPAALSYRDPRDYIQHFQTVLCDAVLERIQDASIRAILFDVSGGLDSSTIASIAARYWTAPFPQYCIHFSSATYRENDDRHYAHDVARLYPPLQLNIITEKEAPLFDYEHDSLECALDVPHSASLIFSQYLRHTITYARQNGIRGYLRGTFGDQVFLPALSPYLWTAWQEQRYGLFLRDSYHFLRMGYPLFRLFSQEWLLPALRPARPFRHMPWHQPPLWERYVSWKEQERIWLERCCPHPFYREFYRLMRSYGTYTSLHASSLFVKNGLEVRDPFTDARMLSFVLACPPYIHIQRGETKHLLREATREILPETVRTRTTKGRLSRTIFAGLHQHAQALSELALANQERLAPFLDVEQLITALQRAMWLGAISQPALFSSLALVVWSSRVDCPL